MMGQCTYLGPEYDPRTWDYTKAPTPYCGCETLEGKNYCKDHYWVVYAKGTSVNGRRKEKAIDDEIAALKKQQELEEVNE